MLNDVIVHVGPSLSCADRPVLEGVVWRPPAQAGDALRAERLEPRVFLLIDGVFDGAPAIRHNELLRLIARGVRVIGAASMGALRACELRAYGMEGVGRVFDAYAVGRLVGDDEVALLHAPAEFGWTPLTAPLVNIRATLAAARRRNLVERDRARAMLVRAQGLPFMDRTWEAVFARDVPSSAFLAFVQSGGFDLKRADALAGLNRALSPAPAPRRSQPPHTVFSARLAEHVDAASRAPTARFT